VMDRYADSLYYVDTQIRRLFDALRAGGRMEETVVVVTGDHGQAFMEHDLASHGHTPYEEVVRVPLVIFVPGAQGRSHGILAQHLDLPPTITHLLGIPAHPAWQGHDLFDASLSDPRDVFLTSQTPIAHEFAVVRGPWKLIWDLRSDRVRLYDLLQDPSEQQDVSAARPDVREQLLARLHTWRHVQLEYYADAFAQQRWYPPVLGSSCYQGEGPVCAPESSAAQTSSSPLRGS
jgi:arylsulfatase A-like enzyme